METQLQLPFSFEEYEDIFPVYVDQAPRNAYLGRGRTCFSCYTPEGIKSIDSNFQDEIQELRKLRKSKKRDQKLLTLRKRILHNEHLHAAIKQNLIENLDEYLKT